MWITLAVMAVAVSLEPFRLGLTVLMLNRPRPLRQLLAFLCGGFAMGLAVGLVVLFALRPALLGSPHFTLPTVQIVVGGLALLAAAAWWWRGVRGLALALVAPAAAMTTTSLVLKPIVGRTRGHELSFPSGHTTAVAGIAATAATATRPSSSSSASMSSTTGRP